MPADANTNDHAHPNADLQHHADDEYSHALADSDANQDPDGYKNANANPNPDHHKHASANPNTNRDSVTNIDPNSLNHTNGDPNSDVHENRHGAPTHQDSVGDADSLADAHVDQYALTYCDANQFGSADVDSNANAHEDSVLDTIAPPEPHADANPYAHSLPDPKPDTYVHEDAYPADADEYSDIGASVGPRHRTKRMASKPTKNKGATLANGAPRKAPHALPLQVDPEASMVMGGGIVLDANGELVAECDGFDEAIALVAKANRTSEKDVSDHLKALSQYRDNLRRGRRHVD